MNKFKLLYEHFIPSIIIGLIGYWVFKRSELVLVALLTGWMIDIDHLFDYILACGFSFSWKEFFSGTSFKKNKKIIVFLHSWELILVWLIGWGEFGRLDIAVIGALSWAGHLILDQFSYNLHCLSYFFIYRLFNNFKIEKICLDV